jgi:hypothetical protein
MEFWRGSAIELLNLSERLRQIPGIEGTHTTIVLKAHLDQPAAIPKIPRSDVDTAIPGSRDGARAKVRPRS